MGERGCERESKNWELSWRMPTSRSYSRVARNMLQSEGWSQRPWCMSAPHSVATFAGRWQAVPWIADGSATPAQLRKPISLSAWCNHLVTLRGGVSPCPRQTGRQALGSERSPQSQLSLSLRCGCKWPCGGCKWPCGGDCGGLCRFLVVSIAGGATQHLTHWATVRQHVGVRGA